MKKNHLSETVFQYFKANPTNIPHEYIPHYNEYLSTRPSPTQSLINNACNNNLTRSPFSQYLNPNVYSGISGNLFPLDVIVKATFSNLFNGETNIKLSKCAEDTNGVEFLILIPPFAIDGNLLQIKYKYGLRGNIPTWFITGGNINFSEKARYYPRGGFNPS